MLRKFKESALAHKYLDGLKGVEIGGAAHNPFGLDTINVDILPESVYQQKQIEIGLEPMKIDVVASGDDLPFDDKSYDFVISSHVIEHFYDPIKALLEWQRVAKKYIFIICPHKERMFDRDKAATTLNELIKRHKTPIIQTNFAHQSYWHEIAFLMLCDHIGFKNTKVWPVDDKVGNGFTVVIKLD